MKPFSSRIVTRRAPIVPVVSLFSLSLLLALLLPASVKAQIGINELMSHNVNAVFNNGKNPDWIEIYNAGTAAYHLDGFGLTDSALNPLKYVFPIGTTVPPKGWLVVWCDSETNAPGLHSGFGLKSNGKAVHLYAPNGTFKIDSIVYGFQGRDISIGRVPDGPTGLWTSTQPTPGLANKTNLLASVTNLCINEWLATNSPPGADWLEVYNKSTNPVALAGLVFTSAWPMPPLPGPTNRPIPALSYIAGQGFVQFHCVGPSGANNPDDLDFKLSHDKGETVTILPTAGVTNNWIDQITFPGDLTNFNTFYPPCNCFSNFWVPDISYGRYPDGGTNILRFEVIDTSPGVNNFLSPSNVIVNEALSNTDPPLEDAIELYNPTATRVDISNWWISNAKENIKKFRVPTNTFIEAGGYKVFYEQRGVTNLPHIGFNTSGTGIYPDFALSSSDGDAVHVISADASGNFTGYDAHDSFGPGAKSIAFGRYFKSNGGHDFVAMSTNTLGMDNPATVEQFRTGTGGPNAYPKIGPLVVNEVMYHPPDITPGVDNTIDEYIEVYNISTDTAFLYDTHGLYCCDTNQQNYADGRTNTWQVGGVINFNFPTNVALNPGQSLLVVNFDPAGNPDQLTSFQSKYGVPPSVPVFGPYFNTTNGAKDHFTNRISASLTNSGGHVDLYRPDTPQDTNHANFGFVPYVLVDRMSYSNIFPWPLQPDGGGKALQRVVPERYGNDATNWVVAEPTPGWQSVHIDSAQHIGNSFVLSFKGFAGSSYSIQYKSGLEAIYWVLLTNLPPLASTGPQQITHSPAASNNFYRIVTPAQP